MREQTARVRGLKRQKLVQRNEDDYTPFVPAGLLPLLGLLIVFMIGLFPFASGVIEARAQATAQTALKEIEADWAKVSVSGQWVKLEGKAPSLNALKSAEDAIRKGRELTGFGLLARPVTRVINAASVASALPLPQTPAVDTLRDHYVTYALDRSVLELGGDIPDQTTRDAILEAARSRFTPPSFTFINDVMRITGEPAPDGFTQSALRGVNTLSRCQAGTASFKDMTFNLNCEASQAVASEIELIAKASLALGKTGRIDIFSPEDARLCNESLETLLSTTRIEFTINSAQISPDSAALLDQVTEAANACPGTLSIVGHTDSSGSSTQNASLSRQRAEAVRRALIDRGIPSERLTAEGLGATQPLADNAFETGRARNRRIEIKVSRGPN